MLVRNKSQYIMNYKEYYTALGRMVYAIAKTDGSIQTEESLRYFTS